MPSMYTMTRNVLVDKNEHIPQHPARSTAAFRAKTYHARLSSGKICMFTISPVPFIALPTRESPSSSAPSPASSEYANLSMTRTAKTEVRLVCSSKWKYKDKNYMLYQELAMLNLRVIININWIFLKIKWIDTQLNSGHLEGSLLAAELIIEYHKECDRICLFQNMCLCCR